MIISTGDNNQRRDTLKRIDVASALLHDENGNILLVKNVKGDSFLLESARWRCGRRRDARTGGHS